MIIVSKEEIKDIYYSDLLYKFHKAKQKMSFFEKKYNMKFIDFENKINNSRKENFIEWDDYIEWKAFNNMFKHLEKEKKEISNGNIKIS